VSYAGAPAPQTDFVFVVFNSKLLALFVETVPGALNYGLPASGLFA